MNKVLKHLKRFSFLYIIWAVVGVFGVIWEYSLLTRATEDEKVDFFICASVKEKTNFNNYLFENKPEYLKEVNTNYIDNNNFVFSQNLSTYGKQVADIYLMNIDKFNLVTGKDYYFHSLDIEKSKTIFGEDITFYMDDNNIAYAIKVELDFFNDEELFLGFAKDSNHLGELGETTYSGAVEFANKLINYEK